MKAITKWMIDGTIDLSAAVESADWNRQLTIDTLVGLGLDVIEAGHFADFIFSDNAKHRDHGDRPEDYLTDAEWDRLTC